MTITAGLAGLTLAACAAMAACGGGSNRPAEAGAATAAAAVATASTPQGAAARVTVKRDNPCSVLLPNEVGDVLGVAISMREVVDETTCHFPYDKPEKDGPTLFAVEVHFEDGGTVVTAARMAGRALGGDAGFERLEGIGDEAWLGPLASMLVFVKSGVGVELDLRLVPDGREKGIRLAKLIASRL